MADDFTDHERWGLVVSKYRSLRLEFEVRDKRDVTRLRGLIPKFQDMPLGDFVKMIGTSDTWAIEFPKQYAEKIVASANASGVACKSEPVEQFEYLIYDIDAGDLFDLDDESEYQRIVEILKANGNPIIEVNEY